MRLLYHFTSKSQAFLCFVLISTTFYTFFRFVLCQLFIYILENFSLFSLYLVSKGYNCLHKVSTYVNSIFFWLHQHYGQFHLLFRHKLLSFDSGLSAEKPLTFPKKYAKFFVAKSCDEDTPFQKDSQRGNHLVQGFRAPAEKDTTSEPQGRNAPPGAPVTASMSGSYYEQPGWNRGILHVTVSHP